MRAQRIELPADADLSQAWDLLHFQGIDPATVLRWQRHGMRVAMLDADDARSFQRRLPRPITVQSIVIMAGQEPQSLETVAPLRGPVRIAPDPDAHPDPDPAGAHASQTPRPIDLPQGLPRWVLRVQQLADGSPRLSLTPQHHVPIVSILPRSPTDRLLDGRVFHSLQLNADLPPQALLVIAPLPPSAAVTSPTADPAIQRSPSTPAAPITSENPDSPTLPPPPPPPPSPLPSITAQRTPPTFGDLTLRANRFGKPVQILLLIHVTLAPSPTPPPTPPPTPSPR